MRLGILGGGRAGWAFGSTWNAIGWPIAGVWLRDTSHSRITELLGAPRLDLADVAASSELLLVGVSDDAIDDVLASIPPTEAIIFHASGSKPSPAGGFSLHPLRALPPVGTPTTLAGSLLVFEGQHRKTARLVAAAAEARFAEIDPEMKTLYHAGAVFGANFAAAVADIAEELMRRAGVKDVRLELAALAESALKNWKDHPGRSGFTGPAARGDAGVVRRHLAALQGDPELASTYQLLSDYISGRVLATKE